MIRRWRCGGGDVEESLSSAATGLFFYIYLRRIRFAGKKLQANATPFFQGGEGGQTKKKDSVILLSGHKALPSPLPHKHGNATFVPFYAAAGGMERERGEGGGGEGEKVHFSSLAHCLPPPYLILSHAYLIRRGRPTQHACKKRRRGRRGRERERERKPNCATVELRYVPVFS